MSANVALSETFDQWRVKTNELLVMTQTDGSPNFVKLTNSTDSTSNSTGSIISAGGMGVTKSVTIGQNLQVHGNIHANGAITANGNITLGDAATDTVTISADLTSHLIPNANNLYDLGSVSQQWADIYATSTNLQVDASGDKAGVVALSINADDVDVQAMTIDGEQQTVNVFSIAADGLTTGSALGISDNSNDTNTRNIVSIVQDHVDALEATALKLQSDGGRAGMIIDKNYASTATATVRGLQLDFDQAGSGTGTLTNFGIDMDVSGGNSGTGSSTSTGLKINMSGTGTNYAAAFTGGNTGFGTTTPDAMVEIESSGAQIKLYDGTSGGATFTTAGAVTTVSGTISSTFAGSISGATAAMTGNITTTADIGANTASITSGAAMDVAGVVAISSEQSTPAQTAGVGKVYTKSDGKLYFISGDITETDLTAGGGGATTGDQNAFTASQYFDDQALTSGSSVAWNANTAQVATLTLGHNATMSNATNHASGGVYILRVTQDSAPKTLAWSSGYKWPGATAPVMTATGGAIDVFTFVSDGTYMYGSFSGSQNFT